MDMDHVASTVMKVVMDEDEESSVLSYFSHRRNILFLPFMAFSSELLSRPQESEELWINRYNEHDFYKLFGMTKCCFNNLINILVMDDRFVAFKTGAYRNIPIENKVLIALHYLAQEETMFSIGKHFNVTKSTVYKCVNLFCKAIIDKQCDYIKWPGVEECEDISADFEEIDGFSGVIGAIDCLNIVLKVPECKQCSDDENLHHSLTLQAVCTVKKLLLNISIVNSSKKSKYQVLSKSSLYKTIEDEGSHRFFYGKYHLIGYSAYPCKSWLMVPFEDYRLDLNKDQTLYNSKLKQSHSVINKTFILLKSRWKRLMYVNVANITNAPKIVKACCILHNFCILNGVPDCEAEPLSSVESSYDFITSEIINDVEGINKRNLIVEELSVQK